LLNKIFRSFHTIKGTAGFLGLTKLQKVTHRCEDILNKLRKGEIKLDSEIMDGILNSYDKLKALLHTIEVNKNEDVDITGTLTILDKLIASIEGKKETAKAASAAPVEVKPEAPAAPKDTPAAPVPVIEAADEHTEAEQAEKAESATAKTEAVTARAMIGQNKTESSIRVDVERLDDLLNYVSELVLGRNRLVQVQTEVAAEYGGEKFARDLADTAKHIDRMTTELQLAVMKTRMVRIGKVFNKFPRTVRDLSKETGKDIQLIINGEETELDKTLIEEINDPLVHLIRNSADHGVEKPEDRIKKGKDPKGTIILSAEHEGNNIIITVQDDGKGIDPDVIKNKAVSKGLITKEKAAELSKQEIYNLIFLPGFSTAEVVTNVSGRGVGMDVVKTNVTKLRGLINVESEVNAGTKIIIKLPLTLAIIQGLLVGVGAETIVIPLNSVIEVVRVSSSEIYYLNQNEVIKIRDLVLPLLSVDKLLYEEDMRQNRGEFQYVVVVGLAEKKFGIKVDELVGQKEVVIKSLGHYLGSVHGISGSTIMGDGKVVMIVDIGELIHYISV
ncbi:MAG TPA: chemotaxis protein CheA, partial [Ignavibacteriales bacterium]|nr:chemotaxis protein CheA [Ignavibacteriales bacterium]